jgi:uncharacterized protein (UPF0332 family)
MNSGEDDGTDKGLPPDTGQLMWTWMWETYLAPEIEQQLADGTVQSPFELVKAQLLFRVGEARPEIRLNDAVRGTAQAVATGPVEAGQELTIDDIGEVHGFILDEKDANAAHVTMLASSTGLNLMFDGRYNALVIASHVEASKEFIASAEDDLDAGRLRSFAQSAFDAAELLAKAELLTLPIADLPKAKTHRAVRGHYNRWAKLGHTDPRFVGLLNQLGDERAAARYLRGEAHLEETKARSQLRTLREMHDHVDSVRPKRTFDEPPVEYSVRVKRDVVAGELLFEDDIESP